MSYEFTISINMADDAFQSFSKDWEVKQILKKILATMDEEVLVSNLLDQHDKYGDGMIKLYDSNGNHCGDMDVWEVEDDERQQEPTDPCHGCNDLYWTKPTGWTCENQCYEGKCSDCAGTGLVSCDNCNGTGEIEPRKKEGEK